MKFSSKDFIDVSHSFEEAINSAEALITEATIISGTDLYVSWLTCLMYSC